MHDPLEKEFNTNPANKHMEFARHIHEMNLCMIHLKNVYFYKRSTKMKIRLAIVVCLVIMGIPSGWSQITNGDFSSGSTGWTLTGDMVVGSGGAWSYGDLGQVVSTFNGGDYATKEGTFQSNAFTLPSNPSIITFRSNSGGVGWSPVELHKNSDNTKVASILGPFYSGSINNSYAALPTYGLENQSVYVKGIDNLVGCYLMATNFVVEPLSRWIDDFNGATFSDNWAQVDSAWTLRAFSDDGGVPALEGSLCASTKPNSNVGTLKSKPFTVAATDKALGFFLSGAGNAAALTAKLFDASNDTQIGTTINPYGSSGEWSWNTFDLTSQAGKSVYVQFEDLSDASFMGVDFVSVLGSGTFVPVELSSFQTE
jgi:hypothetical protein